MKKSRFLYLCLLSLSLTCSYAQRVQRYNAISYNVNEGLLQSNVIGIAFDRNNFCWLSYANGIQVFDGTNFTSVPIQPGLPDDKWVRFFRCGNGDLLVAHSKGISRYEIERNRFTQLYQNSAANNQPVLFIGEDDHIVFFMRQTAT